MNGKKAKKIRQELNKNTYYNFIAKEEKRKLYKTIKKKIK